MGKNIRKIIPHLVIKWRKFGNANKTNAPFLSGDSISEICELTYRGQELTPIEIKRIKAAKSIFVFSDFLENLLGLLSSESEVRVLISGNGDRNFELLPDFPDSLKLFLCQNYAGPINPRVRTLPIGLENQRLGRSGFPRLHQFDSSSKISNRVLVPPMAPTNIQRKDFLAFPKGADSVFDVATGYLGTKKYFMLTRRYKFILVLEGNGFDTHRLWEVLYQGSFPVVLRTPWSESLEYLGLPICYVENFSALDEGFLENFLQSNMRFNPQLCSELWTNYWKDLVGELTEN